MSLASATANLNAVIAAIPANPANEPAIESAINAAAASIKAAATVVTLPPSSTVPVSSTIVPISSTIPGPLNTGPTGPLLTTINGSFYATTPNQALHDILINGTLYIEAPGITIDNFKINALGADYGIKVVTPAGTASDTTGPSVIATHGEILNCASGGIFGSNWKARWLNIHDMGSDATDGAWNIVLRDSWIHLIGSTKGAHADGFQCVNGQNIVIEGNNFDIPWGNPYNTNSCIFLNPPSGNIIANVTVNGNWLNGGNFEIYASGPGVSGVSITNNIFGSDDQYGKVYGATKSQAAQWSGNLDSSGASI